MKWILGVLCVVGFAHAADPQPAAPAAPAPAAEPKADVVQPVHVKEPTDWQARSMKWFKDPKAETKVLRKEMRQATKAIKRPCRYCHTQDFKGYQENRLISQQMMAMSAEHGVSCTDCHGGRKSLTRMGKTAKDMFEISRREKVFCEHCHVPDTRFEKLTKAGKLKEAEWAKRRQERMPF